MIPNMGTLDRVLRLLAVVIFVVPYATDQLNGTLAIVTGILAVVFAATPVMGFCPPYKPFGINTTQKDSK